MANGEVYTASHIWNDVYESGSGELNAIYTIGDILNFVYDSAQNRIKVNVSNLPSGGSAYPTVNTFALLPAAASNIGQVYYVITETGSVFLLNRKLRGLYRSNGATWEYAGDPQWDASEIIYDNGTSGLMAVQVQYAIDELALNFDNYYTKTNLQTSGSALVHWNNITNVPGFAVGDMEKSTYDINNNGIVDDSEKLGAELPSYYLDRNNHTGTQTALSISDFDIEVSNNIDVAANTIDRHNHINKDVLDNLNVNTAGDLLYNGIEIGKIEHIIKVGKSGDVDFTSVKDANDSILDNSSSNYYKIEVGPGTFIEDPFTLKSYVIIEGAGFLNTIIKTSDNNNNFIIGYEASILKNLSLEGPTGTGYSTIYYIRESYIPFILDYVFIRAGYYGIWGNQATSRGVIHLFNVANYYIGTQYENLIRCTGYSTIVGTNCSYMCGAPAKVVKAFYADGPNAEMVLIGATFKNAGSDAIYINNDAILRISNSILSTGNIALHIGPDGSSKIFANSVAIQNDNDNFFTTDILCESATGEIYYSGSLTKSKLDLVIGTKSTINSIDTSNGNEGNVNMGEIFLGPVNIESENINFFPLSSYMHDTIATGRVNGGEVFTVTGGLFLHVNAGKGYINNNGEISQINWDAQEIEITDLNARLYVFINSLGIAGTMLGHPNHETEIELAVVQTNDTDIVFLNKHYIDLLQTTERDHRYKSLILGPLSNSGNITSINNLDPLSFDVTAGDYYISDNRYLTSSATNVTFTYWYNIGSNWYQIQNQTQIDDNNYNDIDTGITAIPLGKFKKDILFVTQNEEYTEYHVLYGNTLYDTQLTAEIGSYPITPEVLLSYSLRIAGIICSLGSTIVSIVDERPKLGQFANQSSSITSHNDLTNMNGESPFMHLSQASYDLVTNDLSSVVSKVAGIEEGAQVNPIIQTLPVNTGFDFDYIVTSNGDGTCTVPANSASFLNDAKTSISRINIALNSSLSLIDLDINYILADRDTGTWITTNDHSIIHNLRYLLYAECYRSGNNLHIQMLPIYGYEQDAKNYARIAHTNRYGRESGLDIIAVDSSLNITSNGGIVYSIVYENTISPISVATRQFFNYHVGGVWTVTSHTSPVINNTQYDDGTNLVTLTDTYWTINYLWKGIELQDHCYTILGNEEFATSDLAKASKTISMLPSLITSHGMLMGRIIVQKGATTGYIIESAFDTIYQGSSNITDHSSLIGLNNDDHPQYLLANGTRSLSGDLNVGGNDITNVGTVDGRDLSIDGSKLDGIESGATIDQIASEVPFTPNGDITAINVQSAIVEVRDDTDTKLSSKVSTSITVNGYALSSNVTLSKSDLSLGNVTNDAQLKRSANDFNTFTEKTSISTTDVILIEDSGALGVKKYVQLENLKKQSITFSASRNSNVNSDIDLRYGDGVPTNISPFVVPVNCKLKSISASNLTSTNETWTASVLVNNVEVATLSINNTFYAYRSDLSVSISTGDRIRLRFLVGSSGSVQSPAISIFMIEV